VTRYRCVDDQKAAGFPVTQACAVMGVSTSAYYDWHAGRAARAEREQRDAQLLAEINTIHREHPDYGSPRVTVELARRGKPTNHKKIESTMAANGVVARCHRRRRGLTKRDETAAPLPDLVGRLFDPDRLDRTWVGDVTYVPTDEGWLYLVDRARPRVAAAARLRHERCGRHRPRHQRRGDGRRGPRPRDHGRRHDLSLRPRLDLHVGPVPPDLHRPGTAPVGRPQRLVPGQRRRRELLRHVEAGAGTPAFRHPR